MRSNHIIKIYLFVSYFSVDSVEYLFSSSEKDIDTWLTKAWTAIEKLSIIWKLDLSDKMKRSFFQGAVVSILLYGITTLTLTKRLEKKLDGNYTRILRAILNKFWRQHPTKHQLYDHLPPITKTIQVRRSRHARYCWRSRDELISDVFLWTTTYSRAKAGRPARTYIQQLWENSECNPEDPSEAMNDREKWRDRVRDIRVSSTTWWWWWRFIDTILWSKDTSSKDEYASLFTRIFIRFIIYNRFWFIWVDVISKFFKHFIEILGLERLFHIFTISVWCIF